MMKRRFKLCALVTIALTVAASTGQAASGGLLHTTFHSDGVSSLADFGYSENTDAIVAHPDGRIVAAGTRYARTSPGNTARDDVVIARYRADGSLDKWFSGDGKLTLNVGPIDRTKAVASDPSNRVIVGGTTYD